HLLEPLATRIRCAPHWVSRAGPRDARQVKLQPPSWTILLLPNRGGLRSPLLPRAETRRGLLTPHFLLDLHPTLGPRPVGVLPSAAAACSRLIGVRCGARVRRPPSIR